MSLNRENVGPAIVSYFQSFIGHPYQLGGGHGWTPSQPIPDAMDCSGSIHVVWWRVTGQDLLDGTSQTMWQAQQNYVIPDSVDLIPGDTIFVVGSDPPAPGHIGTVVSYDNGTRSGTYISFYDTAEGCVEKVYHRNAGWGGDAWFGATRTADMLPAPPPPPPPEEEDMLGVLVQGSAGGVHIAAGDFSHKHPIPEQDVVPVLVATGKYLDLRTKLDHKFVDSIPVV